MYNSPILVTGTHRSGSTWIGKMLSAGGQAKYIFEPLNLLMRPPVLQSTVKHWYTYICPENEADFLGPFQALLDFQLHDWAKTPWAEMMRVRSGRHLRSVARDWRSFFEQIIRPQRALIKDPFAIFSTLWFRETLGCQVVVSVRRPEAFVSSVKRLGWVFEMEHLLSQPLLMRDHLEPYRDQMQALAGCPSDAVECGALLWRIAYGHVARHVGEPGFHLVRHEDLSLNPVSNFRALYKQLGMEFNAAAEQAVLNSTDVHNPGEWSADNPHSTNLNSRASLENWRHRLTPEEIDRVREVTHDVAQIFYPALSPAVNRLVASGALTSNHPQNSPTHA